MEDIICILTNAMHSERINKDRVTLIQGLINFSPLSLPIPVEQIKRVIIKG